MRNVLVAVLGVMAGGCAPQHTVMVDANGPVPRMERERLTAGAGERIHVVVRDTVWGNRWVATSTSEPLPALPRSDVFGSVSAVHALGRWYLPSGVEYQADETRTTPEARGEIERAPGLRLSAGESERVDREIRLASEAHDLAWLHAKTAADELSKLSEPDAQAALRLVLDPDIRALVEALSDDPTARLTVQLLRSLTQRTRIPLSPTELDSVMGAGIAYANAVRALQAVAPEPAAADESLIETLAVVREHRRRAEAELERRDAHLSRARTVSGASAAIVTGADPVLATRVGAFDVAPLLTDRGLAEPEELEEIGRRVAVIAADGSRLAGALDELPYWTRSEEDERLPAEVFEGGNTITVTLVRRPRYPRFQAADAEESKKAASGGTTAAAAAEGDATLRIDVLPRYRFHLGAGLVRSPLDLQTFSTSRETEDGVQGVRVRQAANASSHVFPALLLSYSLFPANGKSYDAREYGRFPRLSSMGLSVQAGVSLQDVTKDVFLGVATEALPGLHLGWGYHLGYRERALYAPGDFVPDSEGAVTVQEWRGAWNGLSLGVDVATFFATLGSLFK